MAIGCSGMDQRLRPTDATSISSTQTHERLNQNTAAASNFTNATPIETDTGADASLRSNVSPVTQATYSNDIAMSASVVEPASVDVVSLDPALANENLTNGATLEDLLSIAFSNNPAVKELAATLQIAAGYRTQVGLYANPILGYQGQQLADASSSTFGLPSTADHYG